MTGWLLLFRLFCKMRKGFSLSGTGGREERGREPAFFPIALTVPPPAHPHSPPSQKGTHTHVLMEAHTIYSVGDYKKSEPYLAARPLLSETIVDTICGVVYCPTVSLHLNSAAHFFCRPFSKKEDERILFFTFK